MVPTPALAALVYQRGADAGVMLTASHNPYTDNGIKFFSSSGYKLTEAEEARIEAYLRTPPRRLPWRPFGGVEQLPNALQWYVDPLVKAIAPSLRGLRIALDCANGAMYEAAPQALRRLGATVTVLGAEPNGVNINAKCGSTHLAGLQTFVRAGTYHLGLAFDGDGDRVLAVDARGELVDGDAIMAILATYLKAKGKLAHNTVVTTVMTNLGFHQAMRREGINVEVTDVGDRAVLELMRVRGYTLGGEQSGHIINASLSTTGDGLATALLLLKVLTERGVSLAEAASVMKQLPQHLLNIKVQRMQELAGAERVWSAVRAEQRRLGEAGRILVRPSGTEPLVRVMAEAPTMEECEAICERLALVIREDLGAL